MLVHARPITRIMLLICALIVAAVAILIIQSKDSTARAGEPGAGLPTCGDTEVEFLGFSDALNKTAFGGFDVAELSGITYDPERNVYYAVADRAGAVQSHFFTLQVPVGSETFPLPSPENPAVLDVTVLKDAGGTPYQGFGLDPEGVAITEGGELFVASEGGSDGAALPVVQQPEVRGFSLSGDELESLDVPARFLRGTNNLTFESAALSPNGHSLFTANEQPLPSVGGSGIDGQTGDLRNRIRILRYENRGVEGFVPAEQFYYLTEPQRPSAPDDSAVADLIALSETHLLVLEKGFKAGEGNRVRIFLATLKHEDDVSDEPVLSAESLVPVEKTLLVDVGACPTSGATNPGPQVNPLLDNFEGMTLGPELDDGRRALILVSDDNSSAVQVTRIIALAVPIPQLVGNDEP